MEVKMVQMMFFPFQKNGGFEVNQPFIFQTGRNICLSPKIAKAICTTSNLATLLVNRRFREATKPLVVSWEA